MRERAIVHVVMDGVDGPVHCHRRDATKFPKRRDSSSEWKRTRGRKGGKREKRRRTKGWDIHSEN